MKTLETLKIASAAVLISLSLVGTTMAADGEELYKTKTCWSCHGKDAKTPILPMYPKLAGQSADYAFNQMKDIKSGTRANGMSAERGHGHGERRGHARNRRLAGHVGLKRDRAP